MMEDSNAQPLHFSAPDFSAYDALEISAVSVPVNRLSSDAGPAKLMAGLSSYSLVPIVEEKTQRLQGVIRDTDLLQGSFDFSRLEHAAQPPLTLLPDATVGEAKQLFRQTDQSLIPVVDRQNRYMGYCVSRRQLIKLLRGSVTPPRIGGLATPLGVYMTSGHYISGAGIPGLVVTGMLFALLVRLIDALYLVASSAMLAWFPQVTQLPEFAMLLLQIGFMLFTILSVIRLTPMAGLHAAEHMTINAIENGLEINAANVRTQPREHVRCGTNLMVLLFGIQIGWIAMETLRPHISVTGSFLYLMFWIFLVTTYWRKAGLWLQTHFTTKPPTDRQLESGMKAGRELLEKYYHHPHAEPGFLQRLWYSGILQMLAAFFITNWVLDSVVTWFLSF